MSALLAPQLISDIRALLAASRQQLQTAVNSAMALTYWQVGRLIVKDEQAGAARAEYGAQQMKLLASQLRAEFGSGFDATNLRNMRQFYSTYPIRDAVRRELSFNASGRYWLPTKWVNAATLIHELLTFTDLQSN